MSESVRQERWTPGDEASRPARSDASSPPPVPTYSEISSPPPAPPRARRRSLALPLLSALIFATLVYAVWEAATLSGAVSTVILPTPLQVAQDFGVELSSGDLLTNVWVTLQEALGGFLLAALIAAVAGYAIAHSRRLEIIVAPFLAASQAIPAVAIAPIIILLLGAGLQPKIVICAVIVVFPLLVTTVTGLRGVGRDYHDVARVFGATRLQTLWLVEMPLAAPTLLSGVKLGLTLSLVGAIVGEFVASESGLGFMINSTSGSFDNAAHYVALISLALLSIALYALVTLSERILLRWFDA